MLFRTCIPACCSQAASSKKKCNWTSKSTMNFLGCGKVATAKVWHQPKKNISLFEVPWNISPEQPSQTPFCHGSTMYHDCLHLRRFGRSWRETPLNLNRDRPWIINICPGLCLGCGVCGAHAPAKRKLWLSTLISGINRPHVCNGLPYASICMS